MYSIVFTQDQYNNCVNFFNDIDKISENLSCEQKFDLCLKLFVLLITSITGKEFYLEEIHNDY